VRLENQVAIITGAAQGIGREYALRFAREGAAVVIAALREAQAQGVEKEIAATRSSLRRKQKRREFLLYSSALTVFVVILYLLTSFGN